MRERGGREGNLILAILGEGEEEGIRVRERGETQQLLDTGNPRGGRGGRDNGKEKWGGGGGGRGTIEQLIMLLIFFS